MPLRLRSMMDVVCCAVALAFRAQMVDEVPVAENDRGVDVIVTADGPIAVSAAGAAALGADIDSSCVDKK